MKLKKKKLKKGYSFKMNHISNHNYIDSYLIGFYLKDPSVMEKQIDYNQRNYGGKYHTDPYKEKYSVSYGATIDDNSYLDASHLGLNQPEVEKERSIWKTIFR